MCVARAYNGIFTQFPPGDLSLTHVARAYKQKFQTSTEAITVCMVLRNALMQPKLTLHLIHKVPSKPS